VNRIATVLLIAILNQQTAMKDECDAAMLDPHQQAKFGTMSPVDQAELMEKIRYASTNERTTSTCGIVAVSKVTSRKNEVSNNRKSSWSIPRRQPSIFDQSCNLRLRRHRYGTYLDRKFGLGGLLGQVYCASLIGWLPPASRGLYDAEHFQRLLRLHIVDHKRRFDSRIDVEICARHQKAAHVAR
jgi:hypothetical protein